MALAPVHLPNRRSIRYLGEGMCVKLDELAGRDQTLLRDLYKRLSDFLYGITESADKDDVAKWGVVDSWLGEHNLDTILNEVRELGQASYEMHGTEELAKVIHDIRGGTLGALLGRLQMLHLLPHDSKALNTLFVLARDHLKILRSCVLGLDEERRNADRKPKGHAMKLMLDKWHEAIIGPKWHEHPIRMNLDCHFEGTLTECCLESAAIDRIFYNITNNACRHVAGDHINMAIFPLPESPDGCLRFVLSNEVGEKDRTFLASLVNKGKADAADKSTGLSLLPLFEPRMSSTGSGFGLTVVADFVAEAFGLKDRTEALRERYVGAILEGNVFRVFFHWPSARDTLEPKLDDYHRPEQSLSEP